MDVLYFAFANDPENPLDELKREDTQINRLLEPLAARNHFRLVRDSYATLDTIAEKLALYKQDLVLFHFSGHAGPDHIQLTDTPAQSEGLARFLGECPNLKLIVLNGCATAPQVEWLRRLKIPLVIATHRPVEDNKAAGFAINFYRMLSLFDTIEAAFNFATGYVLSLDSQIPITRGIITGAAPAGSDGSCWGLFGVAGRETAAQWTFSTNLRPQELENYQPNVRLLDTLLSALAPYRPNIKQIFQREEDGYTVVSQADKRKAILEALPHPISELVRYILVPRSASSQEVFFDQLGLGRLQQIYAVYLNVIELMVFIMLAQLWDMLSGKPGLQVPASAQQLIREFLLIHQNRQLEFDHIALIRAIRELMDQEQEPYFVEELIQLREMAEPGSSFSLSDQFFRNIEADLQGMDENRAKILCINAEEHLADVLQHLGFITRYTFASIKTIDVLKYRHERKPLFRHSIVKLEQRFVGLEAEPQVIHGMLDSASVILLKESDADELPFLNLSPFVIDQNAFDDKATIAKLHFFVRYLPELNGYAFRHIYMANDPLLVIDNQAIYRIIKVQFEAFAKLLFQQPMKNAVE